MSVPKLVSPSPRALRLLLVWTGALTFALVLPTLSACEPESSGEDTVVPGSFPLRIERSELIPTVATVTWELDGATPQQAWVKVGLETPGEIQVAVDLSRGPPYSTTVLGMKPEQIYKIEVQVETDEGPVASDQVTMQTGAENSGISALTLEDIDPARTNGGFLVTSQMALPAVALILDRDGAPVWWYEPARSDMLGRVRISQDGQRVLMGEIYLEPDEDAELVSVSLDGTREERIPMPYRHHDFVELPDGTLGYLAYDPRNVDGELIPGDRIMELRPDGSTVEVYNIWDHHEPDSDTIDGPLQTWPHANALDYDPIEDDWLVSFLVMNMIVRVDRSTGEEQWALGGADSTLATAKGDTNFFQGQHGMELLDDSLLVFINGVGAQPESRVVEVQIDAEQGLAETVWSWQPEPDLSCPILGDVHRFEDGNTLVTFSFNGVVYEIDASDAPVWKLSTGIGGPLSYMTWMSTLQDPG